MNAHPAQAASPRGKDMRHEFVVDRAFQYRCGALFAVIGGAAVLITGLLLYAINARLRHELALPPDIQAELETGDTGAMVVILLSSVVAAGALFLVGVVLSHRISGPIFVMTRHLATLHGDLPPDAHPARGRRLQGLL